MFGLGTTEVIIIAGILVLMFGSKKIADLAAGIAEAVKIFRETLKDEDDKAEEKKVDNKI